MRARFRPAITAFSFRAAGPIGAALISLVAANPAHALIRIIKSDGTPVPPAAYTMTFNVDVPPAGGWDITLNTLYAPGLESMFDIRGNGGEYINSINVAVNGPPAGSPVIVKAIGETPGNLLGVGSIVQTGSAETILNRVQVTQDIGSVQVEAIGDLLAGRDVIGPIIATTPDNSLRGITSVHAVRDILGDCTAEHGRILLVWAQHNIGLAPPAVPVNIRAKYNVYQVQGMDVFANINTRVNGGNGGFWAMVANRFSGSLVCERLIANPWNGLDGLMAIYNQFDGTITIGKNYNTATQYIQTPAHGLAGQIIINADNAAAGGVWTAPVRVGANGDPQQIILNNAGYTQTAAAIGGGAVGLVPFHLHDESCSPVNGATIQRAPNATPPLTVELRHYGPVNWTGALPLTIERRVAGSTGAYTLVSPKDFSVSRAAADRSIILTAAPGRPGFETNYQYRIRPMAQLVCNLPALNPMPAVVWDSDYLLTIQRPPCLGDISQSGAVNVDDLLFVITFWGLTNPAFPAPDINHDGVVNVDDLLIVITHWGPCW